MTKMEDRILSPDPFEETAQESDDSFDLPVNNGIIVKRRSEAIRIDDLENDSFDDGINEEPIGNITIEDALNAVLNNDSTSDLSFETNPNDTIIRLLDDESNDERDFEDGKEEYEAVMNHDIQVEVREISVEPNDALSNLLRSFRNDATLDGELNRSIDLFENEDEEMEEEQETNEDTIHLLPVAIPFAKEIEEEVQPSKRRRLAAEIDPSKPSTSDGPGYVASDVGEYWNQQKTITVNGNTYDINSFGDYMRMKIDKLNHQVNTENSKPFEKISNIFQGYSVFVNGYTDPPALVIRDLMLSHGGEYHCYYLHGKTSYTIASSIATAKIDRIREKEIFIKADWITESIAAGKALNYRDYLIYEKGANEKGQMRNFLTTETSSNSNSPKKASSNQFLDARDPDFIKNYYARSRLHLISTLAQDMKDFVAKLKLDKKLVEKQFDEDELIALKDHSYQSPSDSKFVFHVDLDCFFVSVAVRDRNDLVGKPVAITHSKGTTSNSMSEIASCSYAARSCGVKNGMLVKHALQMCPRLILLPYQFDDYVNVSKQIYEILASYTLDIRAVSCDEMYINASSLCQHFSISDPCQLAEHIRSVIRRITRCPASVGIGSTSLLARLATRHAKPDGVFWVKTDMRHQFMVEEKIKDLPGMGYQMMDRLKSCFGDLTSCGQLQMKHETELTQVFGPKLAAKIFKQCRGEEEDSEEFWEHQMRKSVSCDINYGIRFTKKEELTQLLKAIGKELEKKLTDCMMLSSSITLKLMVRAADAPVETSKFMGHGRCDTYSKTTNIHIPTARAETIVSECLKLYSRIPSKVEDLRGIGVTCGKLKCKVKKDATSAIQEMFGKGRKEKKDKDTTKKVTFDPENNAEGDENEEDEDMGQRIHEQRHMTDTHDIPSCSTYHYIPTNLDIIPARGVVLPEILRLTENQLRKSMKKLKLDTVMWENMEDVERKMMDMCRSEPCQESVGELYQFFETMLKVGKIKSLESLLQKFVDVTESSAKSDPDWYMASKVILDKLEQESKQYLEFPMDFEFRKRIKKENIEVKKVSIDRSHLIRNMPISDTTGL